MEESSEEVPAPYIPYEKVPRAVILSTPAGQVHTAEVWPIDEDQPFRARVMLILSPGEDSAMYRHTIDVLAGSGYETFLCGFEDLGILVKMCVDDLDAHHQNAELHLIASHFGGAFALDYGCNGTMKKRLATMCVVNPLISPSSVFCSPASFGVSLKLRARMKPDMPSDVQLKPLFYTGDTNWLKYLDQKPKVLLTYGQLRGLQRCCAELSIHSRKFDVQKLLVICSNEDPLAVKQATRQFVNSTGAKGAYFLEYSHGLAQLFVERDRIFQRLIADLIMWLDEN